MEIIYNKDFCICKPLSETLDKREVSRIMDEFVNREEPKLALDLSYIEDCTIDFIEALKEKGEYFSISVFNIPSDIFALFNIMDLDKYVKVYACEIDFFENARRIINRKFVTV